MITRQDFDRIEGATAYDNSGEKSGRCSAAAIVRADRVLMIVRAWQHRMAETRVRVMR